MNFEDDILIVDDEIHSLRLLAELLEKEGPSLILLDVRMPEMDGFEVCRRLKQDERTARIPIIFVSALEDVESRIKCFEAGGVDFITKPFEELEILARVKTHLSLHRIQQHFEKLVDERTSELNESKTSLAQKVGKLQESEERYELAVTGSAAGIWDWDILSEKVYYSDRLQNLLGYTAGDFSNSLDEFWNRLHPEEYDVVRMAIDQHLKERETFNIEYRLRNTDGFMPAGRPFGIKRANPPECQALSSTSPIESRLKSNSAVLMQRSSS